MMKRSNALTLIEVLTKRGAAAPPWPRCGNRKVRKTCPYWR